MAIAMFFVSCGGSTTTTETAPAAAPAAEVAPKADPEMEKLQLLIDDANKDMPMGMSCSYEDGKLIVVQELDESDGLDFKDPTVVSNFKAEIEAEGGMASILTDMDEEFYVLVEQLVKMNGSMIWKVVGHKSKVEIPFEISYTELAAALKKFDSTH